MSVSYGAVSDELSAEAITAQLSGSFGAYIRYFDSIGSTNTEAAEWAMCGAPEGSVVVADHQSGGRGRWGRSWFSLPGKLLQFSLILRPEIAPESHGLVTAGLGVACARAVGALTRLPVQVKWPNDLVVEDRKLAGMLVESTIVASKLASAVCGIGINVSLTADDIPEELRGTATSIALESVGGDAPRRAELIARILYEIESLYPAMKGQGAGGLIEEAIELSSVIGRDVVVRFADGSTHEGRADSLDEDAALLLRTEHGIEKIHVGEIEQLRRA